MQRQKEGNGGGGVGNENDKSEKVVGGEKVKVDENKQREVREKE